MKRKCPECEKEYETELDRPEGDHRPIQEIFPDEPLWKREQLISGLCSQRCWNKHLYGIDSDKVLTPEDVEKFYAEEEEEE